MDVRRRLVRVSEFLSHLTDDQVREIVELDDAKMLGNVAKWSENLYPGNGGAKRLSDEAADMLINHIRTHENMGVRAALAENSGTPPQFYPPFLEYVRNGYRLSWDLFEKVSVEDIRTLNGQSREILVAHSKSIEDVSSAEVRKAAITMLAAHPDPEVRLALAENEIAPPVPLNCSQRMLTRR